MSKCKDRELSPPVQPIDPQHARWTGKGYQQSPNLAAITQELVMRDDWKSGHAINILVWDKGSKKRRSVAHVECGPDKAAILEIQYGLPE